MRSPQENMLAVLDALEPEPLTIRELARRTGLPLASVHRVVTRLTAWGALERTPQGVRPGLKLFELGQLVPVRGSLRELALPFMGDLYAATHEVVSLAVLDGTDTVWVEQLAGRIGPPVPSRVGGRLPAHVTAAGKVLLAASPEATEALCANGLERHGPGTITDPERLRADLAAVRERGIAINREESRAGVLGVAAPVVRDGTTVAALALAVARRSRSSPELMAPAVRTAALALGRSLRMSA
ncbi:IclR family transcriptional regulator [Solirubrobacter phytolaccae]|uniref:IclR family transcriptional regulator n=1 Tax=Solirubrobacter phytolaccae TaxID=1404360 RepID=A0A9X3N8G4_9ACTN|nr:IclR family transcriptional regulator [Solirubrobacter phytolaccae]MDA0181678.1 IclR family transcriptional regulator [Solirubrobacter phytolaccae]